MTTRTNVIRRLSHVPGNEIGGNGTGISMMVGIRSLLSDQKVGMRFGKRMMKESRQDSAHEQETFRRG
jgi:hypothetical protein